MTIKQILTDKLIPYENNPRNNDGAVDAVAASIKEDDLGGGKKNSTRRSKRAEEKL